MKIRPSVVSQAAKSSELADRLAPWVRGRQPYFCFGGKGGNGKTTCAGAAAVALAEQGRQVLVVSTDPAHSLGDALGRKLTARPSSVPIRGGALAACELDADLALVQWLARRRPALAAIFQRGTILDRSDIDRFLDLSLPGVDELFGLLEIERLASEDAYDTVVVDTAPTGHTLRLLSTPALFTKLSRAMDAMQEKHRVLAAAFGSDRCGDGSDALIEELRRDGERLRDLLRDRSRWRLCWVMLPEAMSVAESSRALADLADAGIQASDVIVNRLTPAPPSACALCEARVADEAEWLNAVVTKWGGQDVALWTLTAQEDPPQGIAALREVSLGVSPLASRAARPRVPRRAGRREIGAPRRRALPVPLRASRSTRLLIVGGKGGVGKTTCAATLALALARDAPDRRVLLVSTDPAHSIGDVLGEAVGDIERRIAGGRRNLFTREIDAARGWREWRQRYRDSVKQLFERLAGPQADFPVDRAIVEELFELAPPGMDEIVGILAIIEALVPSSEMAPPGAPMVESRFDLVVVDSAPTGHTLRLLDLPAQAQAWVHQLMSVVLKYHLAGGSGQIATDLLWLSRGLRRLRDLLTNSRACGFVVVTRPEQLPALETARLLEWLRRRRIKSRALIVNAVTPRGCARCRRIAARERRHLATFTHRPAWKRGGCPIVLTDAVTPPPQGVAALSAWSSTWRSWNPRHEPPRAPFAPEPCGKRVFAKRFPQVPEPS